MTSTTTLPTHPVTGLRALGMTSRGPVWPVMGGDGTGDGGDGQGGQANAGQQPAGGNGGEPGGQQTQQQGGQEPPLGPDGQPLDPVRLQRLVENLREENRQLKAKGGQQGQGQEPAPQQNQQQAQQAGQEPANDDGTAEQLRAATTELAVYRNAARHGANPVALTDSRSFMDTVGKLDPAAADYDKQVTDAIKKALETHPHYAAGQAPGTSPRGGSDGTGRPGAPARPRGLDGAVSAHYSKK